MYEDEDEEDEDDNFREPRRSFVFGKSGETDPLLDPAPAPEETSLTAGTPAPALFPSPTFIVRGTTDVVVELWMTVGLCPARGKMGTMLVVEIRRSVDE